MKSLQKLVMTDTQYLMYFLKKTKEDTEFYNEFCSTEKSVLDKEEFIERIWNNYSIDLYPYLYTINSISATEFKSFLIYFMQHALAVDINVSKVAKILNDESNKLSSNLDIFYNIIMGEKIILVSILSVMQYYFI